MFRKIYISYLHSFSSLYYFYIVSRQEETRFSRFKKIKKKGENIKKLEDKSQITLIIQSLITIILFFICEMLFFTYLTKPMFYIIGIICLFLTLGLCTFFKFNLFSFKSLKKKELAIIIISFLILEISTSLITSFASIPANEEGLNEGVKHSKFFIAIITLGIFIPIIEECIFRGTLIKVMFQKKQWLG